MTILFTHARKLDAAGQVDDFWMLVDDDTIVSTGAGNGPAADQTIDVGGAWLTPGFIDLHSHGAGGFSYDDGVDAITGGVAIHRAHGTTRSVISLVTNPIPMLEASLAGIAELAAVDPLILGSHLEGPYLSPERAGAHNPALLREPQPGELNRLMDAAHGTLRQLTIAPELPNALELIEILVENEIVVAVGHSQADFALARKTFDIGARLLTHAFNAMPGIGHRAPGPVIAAFEDSRVTLELILDGEHVHPDVAALAFRSAPGRIALITDAMSAAGSSDGDYDLGTLTVEVRDGAAHIAGTDILAGSTLTQDRALRFAIEKVRVNPVEAVAALTLTPATVLGLESRHGLLAAGYASDAVQLDSRWRVEHVWANGVALS
ncbi:MAG TPA: N-acetylglucosamine-6-phosphate deacetylase [Galbitalea sp.]|nr:N-acetylglucosamine-6-phosphate deacetylase [Galbitalea sp.]